MNWLFYASKSWFSFSLPNLVYNLLFSPMKLKCGVEQDDDPLNGVIPPEGRKHLMTLE